MKMKFELTEFNNEKAYKIPVSKIVQENMKKSKQIYFNFTRGTQGGQSNFKNISCVFAKEGNIKHKHKLSTLTWGEKVSIRLPDRIDFDTIEFVFENEFDRGSRVLLVDVGFEMEEEKGIIISGSVGSAVLDSNGFTALHVDKIIDGKLSFGDFQEQALHRLQQQFLNTPDTKDTVLTRMNIIQMIKDLKELGLK